MGTLYKDVLTFMRISRLSLLRMRNIPNKVVEKFKTYIYGVMGKI
jgi:hypothetical protein